MATQQEQKDVAATGAPAVAEADDFAALLKQNFKPRSERAASEVENAVQTLVTQALADSSLVKGDVSPGERLARTSLSRL
jgi:type VI secretion system protein ImpC